MYTRMHTHTHTHTHTGILLSHKKNEILPIGVLWVDLESILLSEINQTETNTLDGHSHAEHTGVCMQSRDRPTGLENKL